LLIPSDTDAPLGQAAFDDVIWTFQSPSNVEAADGVAKPNAAANSEAAIRDFEDVIMASPFGLNANTISRHRPGHRDHHHKKKAPRFRGAFVELSGVIGVTCQSVDAGPGLAAAEHAAKSAALNAQRVGALQRDRRIVAAAAVRIENPAAPLVIAGLHVDQDLLAVLVRLLVDRIAAEVGAAFLDSDLAFLFLRQPDTER